MPASANSPRSWSSRASAIPARGETEFVSTRLAWDRLSDAQMEELRDVVVVHSYATSRDQFDPALMTPVERAALPPVRWPLIWHNPANARDALYIASHAGAIEGMDDVRGRAGCIGAGDGARFAEALAEDPLAVVSLLEFAPVDPAADAFAEGLQRRKTLAPARKDRGQFLTRLERG